MSIKKNRFEVLINPTEEQVFEREPLMKFSFYLNSRHMVLISTLDEITENLDNGFSGFPSGVIDGSSIGHASSLMWYWTLRAYEVIRTISQAKDCFSSKFIEDVNDLKRDLSKARMPSAKMEKRGKREPVISTRSPDGWDYENKDLLIGDPYDYISARKLLQKYDEIMTNLKPSDVLKRHEESY
ncbi:MAG: hypothetical protein R3D00_30880 [Bacteroidia bacterium]